MKTLGTADVLAGLRTARGRAGRLRCGSPLRLPFSRPWSGRHEQLAALLRLVALILIEAALLILVLIVVGTVVIPFVEPPLPTPTAGG